MTFGKVWSAEEDALVDQAVVDGLTTRELAPQLPHRSYGAVEQRLWAARHGTRPTPVYRDIRCLMLPKDAEPIAPTDAELTTELKIMNASAQLAAAIRLHHPSRCETLEAGA